MNHVGTYDAIEIATAYQQHVALAAAQPPYPNPVAVTSEYREYQGETTLINAPTYRDRLYGQGMGVQRHPGNVIFRALVFANQAIYATAPTLDEKMKISKAIVAAVREQGGRFLQFDPRTQTYSDVGDKKATTKTGQSLRENQPQTLQKLHRGEVEPVQSNSFNAVSEMGYLGYSLHVLNALHKEYEDATTDTPEPKNVPDAVPTTANNDAMAMALDQFPVVYTDTSLPLAEAVDVRPSVGRFTTSSFSIGSIRELLVSARDETEMPAVEWMGARGTMMSLPSNEVRALIRTSESLLAQIEDVAFDVLNDRVSELELRLTDMRFTEMSKDFKRVLGDGDLNPRSTDITSYSSSSLMRASLMTIARDDMSFFD